MQRELEYGDFYDNVAAFEVIKFLAANGAALEAVQRWNDLRRHIVAHGDEQSRRVLLPAIKAQIESATAVSFGATMAAQVEPTQPTSSHPDRAPASPTGARKPHIEACPGYADRRRVRRCRPVHLARVVWRILADKRRRRGAGGRVADPRRARAHARLVVLLAVVV